MLSLVTRTSRHLFLLSIAALSCAIGCSHSSSTQTPSVSNQAAQPQARGNAQGREKQRQQLGKIPPPTKSQYIDVHGTDTWENPFLSVGTGTIKMRVIMPDANPSPVGQGGLLRPTSARRQELEIRIPDLPEALTALPANAWPYGRVIAVAEGSTTDRRQRPQIRRNVEATIQVLNDLGIVVDEWPVR
jgi:hypothetical protein